MKSRLPLIAYATALLVVIIDQAAKAWVLHGLRLFPGAPYSVLPFFNLTLTSNTGVS